MTYNLGMVSLTAKMVSLNPRNGLSFLLKGIIILGVLLNLVVGGYIWSADFNLQVISAIFFTVVTGGYLFACWLKKIHFWATGLEFSLVLYSISFFISFLLSSDRSNGFWKLISLISLGLIFYCLVEFLKDKSCRDFLLGLFIWISGIVLFLAILEMIYAYRQYWIELGGIIAMPPTPYRVTGVLGHANALMAYTNLFAPIALTLFIQAKKQIYKVFLFLWGLLFLIVLPFTSSRGGWLGTFTWLVILVFLLRKRIKWWNEFLQFVRTHKTWVLPLIIIGLAGLMVIGYIFVMKFAGYRLSNANPFSGRSEMWNSGLAIWRQSPWIGTGPGNFPFQIFNVVDNIPPKYWPSHAHNLFINILAELGVIGLLTFVGLIIAFSVRAYQIHRTTSEDNHLISSAIIASLIGLMIQMLVDDFSSWLAILVPVVVLSASQFSFDVIMEKRARHVSYGYLLIPFVLSVGLMTWRLWISYPAATALMSENVDLKRRAELIVLSSERESKQVYFLWQAGLAWAEEFEKTKDASALIYAINSFEKFVERYPKFSLAWANLGNLYSRENSDKNIQAFQKAIELAPYTPAYHLNFAIELEKMGSEVDAKAEYLKVLELSPAWSGDPFWLTTPLRNTVLEIWQKKNDVLPESDLNSIQAVKLLELGNIDSARKLIADARWIGEPGLAVATSRAYLAAALDDHSRMVEQVSLIKKESFRQNLDSANLFADTYSLWITHMRGAPFDLVPGFIQLNPDYGQYAVMDLENE